MNSSTMSLARRYCSKISSLLPLIPICLAASIGLCSTPELDLFCLPRRSLTHFGDMLNASECIVIGETLLGSFSFASLLFLALNTTYSAWSSGKSFFIRSAIIFMTLVFPEPAFACTTVSKPPKTAEIISACSGVGPNFSPSIGSVEYFLRFGNFSSGLGVIDSSTVVAASVAVGVCLLGSGADVEASFSSSSGVRVFDLDVSTPSGILALEGLEVVEVSGESGVSGVKSSGSSS